MKKYMWGFALTLVITSSTCFSMDSKSSTSKENSFFSSLKPSVSKQVAFKDLLTLHLPSIVSGYICSRALRGLSCQVPGPASDPLCGMVTVAGGVLGMGLAYQVFNSIDTAHAITKIQGYVSGFTKEKEVRATIKEYYAKHSSVALARKVIKWRSKNKVENSLQGNDVESHINWAFYSSLAALSLLGVSMAYCPIGYWIAQKIGYSVANKVPYIPAVMQWSATALTINAALFHGMYCTGEWFFASNESASADSNSSGREKQND